MSRNAVILFALSLAGCATPPTVPPSPVETVRYVQVRAPSEVDKLLFYVDKIQAMTAEERQAEREHLQQTLVSGGGDKVRLRYALLLIWSPTEEGLEAQRRLLRAVDPASFGEDAMQVKALVGTLLHALDDGPRQLDRRWRRRLQRSEARITSLEAEKQRLQAEIEALRSQIDALKAIERSIQQRMTP